MVVWQVKITDWGNEGNVLVDALFTTEGAARQAAAAHCLATLKKAAGKRALSITIDPRDVSPIAPTADEVEM